MNVNIKITKRQISKKITIVIWISMFEILQYDV